MKHQIVSRWDSAKVLFECELPDDMPSGMATLYALEKAIQAGSNLSGSDLRGSNLSDAKNDFWEILLRAPREIAGLRLALAEGRVDGSTYEGACACLVGTIANVRGQIYRELSGGIKPNSSRPAERWFLAIQKGDTPETNQVSKITVEWVDEFVGLLALAVAPTAAE